MRVRTKRKSKTTQPAPQPTIWQMYASISILILENKLSHDVGLACLSFILSQDPAPEDGPGSEALLGIPSIAQTIPLAVRKRVIAEFKIEEARG